MFENERFYGITWCAQTAVLLRACYANLVACVFVRRQKCSMAHTARSESPRVAADSLQVFVVNECRKPPPVLDRAAWTDCTGNAVQLRKPPHEDPGEWELVVTPGTDDDGWQYGTVFQ